MTHRPPRPWTLRAAFAFGLAGLLIACGSPGDDAAQHDVDDDSPAGHTVGPPDPGLESDTSLPDASPEPLAPGGPHAIGDAPERTTPPSRAHAHPEFMDPHPPEIPSPSEDDRPVVEGFAVHEWGTFTSVVGSDGIYLPGLHHEEEALPSFVHRLCDGFCDDPNYFFLEADHPWSYLGVDTEGKGGVGQLRDPVT